MRSDQFRIAAACAALLVAGFAILTFSPYDDAAKLLDELTQLAGGVVAVICCLRTAANTAGRERQWRLLAAAGVATWTAGQTSAWFRTGVVGPPGTGNTSWWDAGYLGMPLLLLPAVLLFAAESGGAHAAGRLEGPPPGSVGRPRTMLLLDGLIVVGSLLTLAWSTALGEAFGLAERSTSELLAASVFPVADLVVLVVVLLLLGLRRAHWSPQLLFLGGGLVALAASDSIYRALNSSNTDQAPLTHIGMIAGPLLIALAAVVPDGPNRLQGVGHTLSVRGHLTLPYLPLAATGLVISVQTAFGRRIDPSQVYLLLALTSLVVFRQLLTLTENVTLLEQIRKSQDQMEYQAYHDPLTGLANRALFAERVQYAVERFRRDGWPLALMFCDLDDFKKVNDTLGHAAGDELLFAVAERLKRCVRGSDMVARLGGDEFGVLLERDANAATVGQRIVSMLGEPFALGGRMWTTRGSVGAVVPDPGAPITADLLLQQADAAMYRAKRAGKGRLVFFQPGVTPTTSDPDLPGRLAAALRNPSGGGLHVFYQPIVRLKDGSTLALEALARWRDPVRGPVPADVFVTVAERNGLIAELDDHVLDQACRDLVAIRSSSGLPLAMHVNVSASRLGDTGLDASVRAALHRNALPGSALVLEISDAGRVSDLKAANRMLQRMRALGVRLALDDFGAGTGSLAHLHLLPVDIVKLDALGTAIEPNPARAEAVRRAIVSISRALGMLVVAEGIEVPGQAAEVAELGCDLGQGWLFGRPAPVDQLALVPARLPDPGAPGTNPAGAVPRRPGVPAEVGPPPGLTHPDPQRVYLLGG